MPRINMSFDDYMNGVGAKISAAKADLMKGKTERGFMETGNRIRQSAANFYFSQGPEVNEPVGATFQAFSEMPGMNDVSNVAAVDVVDINIAATQQSIMGYLSAERAMDKPIDTAWYQGLVATNANAPYAQGDTVFTPFSPMNANINLGTVTATGASDATADITASATIDLGKQLSKKGVVLTATLTSGTDTTVVATGTDLKGDGVIYWNNGTACDSATVNYETGVITIVNEAASTVVTTITAVANIERTAQSDGANTLKVKPKTVTTTLTATPNRIILENSFEDNMYVNKQAYNLSNIGVSMDFGKRAINQLLQSFVFYLDTTSVIQTKNVMINGGTAAESDTLDMTDYAISSSEASTKNDIVNQYVLKLNKKLQVRSGKGPTCYLVDSEGAIILGNNPMYFDGNPTFDQNLDGMIGTYHGIPVVRHHALNNIFDTTKNIYGFVGAVYKSPDGQTAPTMYGEYLPPYSVTPALNYDNPAQYSQALLSMSTTQPLVSELACYMKVLVSAQA